MTGDGVPKLYEAIEAAGRHVMADPPAVRRRRRARYLIARAAADLVAKRIRDGQGKGLEPLADQVLAGAITPDDAAAELIADR
jgi:LAO/AO transport system kinase